MRGVAKALRSQLDAKDYPGETRIKREVRQGYSLALATSKTKGKR
jgi:hypothetical protein